MNNTRSIQTRKVSCQYPIVEIEDLSPDHPDNKDNNTWLVTYPYPTKEQVEAEPDYYPKVYEAKAWARPDEELKFRVRFGEGSHMGISWKIVYPGMV